MSMMVEKVVVRRLNMELRAPFTTSFGTFKIKDFLLVEAVDGDGASGWGESVAFHVPLYNEETLKTNWHMLEDYLIPLLLRRELSHPDQVNEIFAHIRKNNMAKSAIEGAVWDLYAKKQGITLAQALGGERKEIEVGISLGIQEKVDDLLRLIERGVAEGYRRIKVKIAPGWDVDVMREVRRQFPDIALMADANSAYTLRDVDLLAQLDEFGLTMVEQPLSSDDIIDHVQLQKRLATPVCLDESIHSVEDARKALEIGACKVINIKIGRVGGLTEAKKIHDLCAAQGVPVWCGGMLESGVGRAHNVAITTLSGFTMPGDTAASSRYWEQDIIKPEVTVDNGLIQVPAASGIGYEVDRSQVEAYTVESKVYGG